MDDQIRMFYSKGLSTRKLVQTFMEMYDADLSATLISRVADSVLEQITPVAIAFARSDLPRCVFGLYRLQN